jgi:hypothetical protein
VEINRNTRDTSQSEDYQPGTEELVQVLVLMAKHLVGVQTNGGANESSHEERDHQS